MDTKEFIEEVFKSQNDQEVPWHLKTLCEHMEILKNGRKIIINPIRQATCRGVPNHKFIKKRFNEIANRNRSNIEDGI